MDSGLRDNIIAGAYWLHEPAPGAELAIACMGAVTPEAQAAWEQVLDDVPGAGLMAVTSAGRLHADWMAACRDRAAKGDGRAHIEQLLAPLAADAALVTVLDGHPASLDWIGSVGGYRLVPLGVERFGQSGDIPDLYRTYGIDTEAILNAAAVACMQRLA